MYEGSGGSDVNVPPLPSRRSATNRQRTGTPPLPARRQTFAQTPPSRSAPASVRSEPVPASSSSSSSSRLSLVHLDRRVESSRSRAFNDYRDLPTTAAVRPGDAQLVSLSSPSDADQTQSPPPRDVELPTSRKKHDHQATTKTKENGTPKATECRESIICQRCGRCRCEECARRPSAGRRVVEICSCVSCVRALRRRRQLRRGGHYHGDDDEATSADICSCGPCRSDCRRRWALLVALSVCVPCLCLYWPLRCAAGRQVRGCRCVERCSWRPSGSATESVVVDRVTST